MTKATKGERFVAPHVGPIPDAVIAHLTDYVWSPKLNGHRALLSPTEFISRGGRDLVTLLPANFVVPYSLFAAGFTALEGELVLVDGTGMVINAFPQVSSVISNMEPYPNLRFFLFDAKGPSLPFEQRMAAIRKIFNAAPSAFIQVLPQFAFPKPTTREGAIRSIATHMKTLPYQSEGFVLRKRDGTYQDPDMYKMVFVAPYHQVRVQLVRIGPQTGTVVFPDGARKELLFTAKANKLIHHIAMNMPGVKAYEVIVDTHSNKIVGLGTDWL